MTVGTPLINPDGTAATLPITVSASARGRFTLLGTNTFGESDTAPTSGNTLTLFNAQDDVDSDGDGFPDGLELLFGSDPVNAASVPALNARGDVRSGAIAVLNTAIPTATTQAAVSAAFTVSNTQLPSTISVETATSAAFTVSNSQLPSATTQTLVSTAFSVLNSANVPTSQQVIGPAVSVLNALPGTPEALSANAPISQTRTTQPFGISMAGLVAGQTLIEGQTLTVEAPVAGGDGNATVTFAVNNVPLVTDTSAPYSMTFTVPAGVSSLTFGASVQEGPRTATATAIVIPIERDVTTRVSGRVVDAAGTPVAGAVVELLSEGLRAEFFDYATPLTALPNIADTIPTRSTRVTAVNLRGPNGLFGLDPFGAGLAPDYAARFTGWIAIPSPGPYTFYLGSTKERVCDLEASPRSICRRRP